MSGRKTNRQKYKTKKKKGLIVWSQFSTLVMFYFKFEVGMFYLATSTNYMAFLNPPLCSDVCFLAKKDGVWNSFKKVSVSCLVLSYILFFKMQCEMKTSSPRPPLFLSLTTDPVGQGSPSDEESILQLNRFKTSSSFLSCLSFDFHCRNPHKELILGTFCKKIEQFSDWCPFTPKLHQKSNWHMLHKSHSATSDLKVKLSSLL